jgi:hypothetical protein
MAENLVEIFDGGTFQVIEQTIAAKNRFQFLKLSPKDAD